MELAERLQELLDRREIVDLKYAYARHADVLDPELMVSRFVEDCTASYHPAEPDIVGRDALRDWYAMRLGAVVSSSHHVSNLEVRFVDADHAELSCYLYSWQRYSSFPDEADRQRWGRYEDTWVRTDQGWFQSSLTCRVAGELSSDAVPRVGEYLLRTP